MRLLAILIGCLVFAARASASLDPIELRESLRAILGTPSGQELAKALLGPKVTRFNIKGSQEVLNSLEHPENQELAEEIQKRLRGIRDGLHDDVPQLQGLSLAEISKDSPMVLERAVAEQLAFTRRAGGVIRFSDNGAEFSVHTAYAARRAEFVMGGETVTLRRKGAPASALAATPPPRGFRKDAFEQLLAWEEKANLAHYQETTQFFGLKMGEVDPERVRFESTSELSRDVRDLFVRADRAYWPAHPFNRATHRVPFMEAPVAEAWSARLTASRSMVVWNREKHLAFSVKAPTNHPHRTDKQQEKVDLTDDIASALIRSEYLARLDRKLGEDDAMGMLREVLTAAEATTGNGYVVRDLTPLLDGHYYLPALSIPFVGERIAALNGSTVTDFWGEAYGHALGRAKARLLIRYGIQMETPNAQNMLIQLDRGMRPTGKIVFRDVSDTMSVKPILETIGEHAALEAELKAGYQAGTTLEPETYNSFWRMDETGYGATISAPVLGHWQRLHDEAYVAEILKLTGWRGDTAPKTVKEAQAWLFSAEGLAGVRAYHAR